MHVSVWIHWVGVLGSKNLVPNGTLNLKSKLYYVNKLFQRTCICFWVSLNYIQTIPWTIYPIHV